jgi:hypothetical protein
MSLLKKRGASHALLLFHFLFLPPVTTTSLDPRYLVRGHERDERDDSSGVEQARHLPHPPHAFRPVVGTEAQVAVQTSAHFSFKFEDAAGAEREKGGREKVMGEGGVGRNVEKGAGARGDKGGQRNDKWPRNGAARAQRKKVRRDSKCHVKNYRNRETQKKFDPP